MKLRGASTEPLSLLPDPARLGNWWLVPTACFAVVWICHRAALQSITLDEANTFLRWVASDSPSHWESNSNNHVLNSILMRLSVWLFGIGHLSVRAPALLGGVLYIYASLRLCSLFGGGTAFRFALFLCSVYNPFIMDYLVAARGYGLALGFLAYGVFLFARMFVADDNDRDRHALARAVAVSASVALSICASFTFAYAGGWLLFVSWSLSAARSMEGRRRFPALLEFTAAHVVPAIAILTVIAGSALTNFPRDQLFWGAASVRESWREIRDGCFAELNPSLVNPLLAGSLEALRRYLFKGLAVFAVMYVILLWAGRERLRAPGTKSRFLLAVSLFGVLVLSTCAHWLQFKLFQIPLPLERTSLFVLPLATAMFGAGLSVLETIRSERFAQMVRAVRGFGVAILLFAGVYFVGELRDSYFREWREGSEVRAAFSAVVEACRRSGAHEVASDPNLASSFTFYAVMAGITDIDFRQYETAPPDKPVYAVLNRNDRELIGASGVETAWRGKYLAVLVRR